MNKEKLPFTVMVRIIEGEIGVDKEVWEDKELVFSMW